MDLKIRQLHHTQLRHRLQGGIFGAQVEDQYPPRRHYTFVGLNTKTLVFLNPASTVTFVLPPSGEDIYDFDELKLQIETQEPLLFVTKEWGQLVITRQIPNDFVRLGFAGTANNILGFTTNEIRTGTHYNPPYGVAPRLLKTIQIGNGMIQLVTDG